MAGREIGAGNGRLVLILIAGIPLTMILAATWLWYDARHGDLNLATVLGTANNGTLIQPPRGLHDVQLVGLAGERAEFPSAQPRWTLLIPARGNQCAHSCEHSLYLTRQLRVALGKYANRVQRAYVSDAAAKQTRLAVAVLSDERPAPSDFIHFLESEQRDLVPLRIAEDRFRSLFAENLADSSTWYLVDPAGWIMMSYNSAVAYNDVIGDLKFLLKNSSG